MIFLGMVHQKSDWQYNGGVFNRILPLFIRVSLGAGFLSAVSDRFGLYGDVGSANVAWGNFAAFMEYTALLNPWAPQAIIAPLAWIVTFAECILGVALIIGLQIRWVSLASGMLLLLFAIGMTVGTGIHSALSASVFAASGAAFSLSSIGSGPFSISNTLAKGNSHSINREVSSIATEAERAASTFDDAV